MNETKEYIEEKELEIKRILYENGKDYFLNDNIHNIKSIDKINEKKIVSEEFDSQDKLDFEEIKNIIGLSLNSIGEKYKRLLLLYWGGGMRASQIISLINKSNFSTKLDDINIKEDNDLYKYITIICNEVLSYMNNHHRNYFFNFGKESETILTVSKVRKILKLYFSYIYDQPKDKEETDFWNQIKDYIKA